MSTLGTKTESWAILKNAYHNSSMVSLKDFGTDDRRGIPCVFNGDNAL